MKKIPEEWFKAAEAAATHCGCTQDIEAVVRAVWPLIARTAFKEGFEWGHMQAWDDKGYDDSGAWRDSDTRALMEDKPSQSNA